MKRNIGKILAMAIVAIMMMSTIAFADAAMGEPAVADNTVTVTLSGLTANEEATILVVTDDVALASVTESDIVYIDQLTVAEDGTVTFTLDASAAVPAEPTADVYVDIYCGYTNMADADPLSGTAKIYTHVEEEPEVPTVKYGDAYQDGSVDGLDALVILMYESKQITTLPYMPDGSDPATPNTAWGDAYQDGTGSVDGLDALVVLMYESKQITELPYVAE